MKSWVKEKLKIVEELFPEDRLNKSKNRWTQLWSGDIKKLDRYPFVYSPLTMNCYDIVETPEDRLLHSFEEFINRGRITDDFIPTFFPGCSTATIPNMFGAPEVFVEGNANVEEMIHGVDEIRNLPDPKLGAVAQRWLEMQKYFLEETEGRIPIHVADMQGPVDVCGKIWNYQDLFLSAYDHPENFHRLMTKASDAFLMLWQAQTELLGKHLQPTHLFGWSWTPLEDITTASCDSIVMVSPDFFEEFYRPHLERIASHFKNGLVLHSCGDLSAHVKTLLDLNFIRGINAGQLKVKEFAAAGGYGSKPFMCAADRDELPEIFDIIRDKHLRVDITIRCDWYPSSDPRNSPNIANVLSHHKAIEKMSVSLAEDLRRL